MSKYERTYTNIKELRFLVLIAIKELTEEKGEATPIPLHNIVERLEANKKNWDRYNMGTPFEDKLSDALASLNTFDFPKVEGLDYSKEKKKAAIYLGEGGWFRGEAFEANIKKVATELADVLDFDMAVPIEVEEPEYEKNHLDEDSNKKTVMTYKDFQKLAAILNEDIYKTIGRTTFEQSAWLRKEFGKALEIKE